MAGVRVGNRIVGADSPVTVGWDNVERVEGGAFKKAFFTYFQPVMLFAAIAFWYYAPNEIAVASTGFKIFIGFSIFLMLLEWINPRYGSWNITWKEFATDIFYLGMGMTVVTMMELYWGADAITEWVQGAFDWESFAWFVALPLLVQALAISLIFDFGQYWMHRGMHNWQPLWIFHAPHHYITQLNVYKGSVGHPIELFLIGLGVGGFFDFLPRAFLIAGAIGLMVGSYQHINTRFNSPRWWRFLFNTTDHHSVHHSQDYEGTRSNYGTIWIIFDRMFGTCVDGEAELLGMEGGRRMKISETMVFPWTEGRKAWRDWIAQRREAKQITGLES
ncbi:sterol desaturase family protein [Qipengyuania vesicularis]|uniref:sterol desaturase family protein n=1 Tax=Qipengyuania vesicularis TaxID=2867232 RepID=UPI001C885B15|nr:sterol desaturase family protein [Qipengyuania vesicularis]MBX7526385.1 sterol desaturase family protein [Qipengyuania vesicularis]